MNWTQNTKEQRADTGQSSDGNNPLEPPLYLISRKIPCASHQTALELTRLSRCLGLSPISHGPLADCETSGREIVSLLELCDNLNLTTPPEVIFPHANNRRLPEAIRQHVDHWSKRDPTLCAMRFATTSAPKLSSKLNPCARQDGSLSQDSLHQNPWRKEVSPTTLFQVVQPELIFLQLAQRGNVPQIALLGMELCGCYSLSMGNDMGFTQVTPISNINTIRRAVTIQQHNHGYPTANKALSLIADNAGSPLEAALFLLLTMPKHLGGYELPKPQLNVRIELESTSKGDSRHFIGDLVWKKQGLIVEYDSNAFHSGTEKLNKDSQRRTELSSCGYDVISCTWEQIRNLKACDTLAKSIACKVMDKPWRAQGKCFPGKQAALRTELFPQLRHRH